MLSSKIAHHGFRVPPRATGNHNAGMTPRDEPPPKAPERTELTGIIREPRAMPSAFLWVSLMILAAALLVLAVVRLTSEPEDRAPLPATPPESLEPADGNPLD